jgi:hypothetical protein
MDVVRERIEALNGRIGIQSVPGVGTTFTIQVPEALRLPGVAARDALFPVLAEEPAGVLR